MLLKTVLNYEVKEIEKEMKQSAKQQNLARQFSKFGSDNQKEEQEATDEELSDESLDEDQI